MVDYTCDSSARQTISLKCQGLFSQKQKKWSKKKNVMSSLLTHLCLVSFERGHWQTM